MPVNCPLAESYLPWRITRTGYVTRFPEQVARIAGDAG